MIKEVPGSNGKIGTTIDGKVYRLPFTNTDSIGRTYKYPLKEISQIKRTDGRLQVNVHKLCKGITSKVHRLVALSWIPNPENKPQVNHIDGNPLNNHVDNLEWVTDQENKVHAWQNGLMKKKWGVKSSNGKLSDNDIIKIRERCLKGEYYKDIANDYNVHPNYIYAIKNGKRRSFLESEDSNNGND